MRALIVFLALAVAVMICMAFVVLFAGINVGSAVLATIGLGIFMVGALFAAIAALGPKSPPTPLLTPTIAGTTAVVLTSIALIAGTAHLVNAHRSIARGGEPEQTATPQASVIAPARKAPETGLEPIQFPGVTIVPNNALPGGLATAVPEPDVTAPPASIAGTPPAEAFVPMAPQPDLADTLADIPEPMAPQPDFADTLADIPEPMAPQPDFAGTLADIPEPMASQPDIAGASDDGVADPEVSAREPFASPAVTPIPIPPIPPPPTERRTSAPPSPPSSQTLTGPQTATGRTSANPPLPRSRPCGAGGPPCP